MADLLESIGVEATLFRLSSTLARLAVLTVILFQKLLLALLGLLVL